LSLELKGLRLRRRTPAPVPKEKRGVLGYAEPLRLVRGLLDTTRGWIVPAAPCPVPVGARLESRSPEWHAPAQVFMVIDVVPTAPLVVFVCDAAQPMHTMPSATPRPAAGR